jgi:uncharacterized LabA/DUF88 family protein
VENVAIFLDGGFVKIKLQKKLGRFPNASDVVTFCSSVMQQPRLKDSRLFRIFYYDAPPFEGSASNPFGGGKVNYSGTVTAKQNRGLIDALELQPDFAVRRGELLLQGWKLGKQALKKLPTSPRPLVKDDVVPDFKQKGVDIKIGLDIAWISLKQLASVLVLVTGDSDLVPAMKFARKEGLKVYLEAMGHSVRRELKAHADFVF